MNSLSWHSVIGLHGVKMPAKTQTTEDELACRVAKYRIALMQVTGSLTVMLD